MSKSSRDRLQPLLIGAAPRSALAIAIGLVIPMVSNAGDILRGGSKGGQRSGGATPSSPNPVVVDEARINANDALSRATHTLQSMQSMQKVARDLAQKGNLKNLGTNPNRPGTSLPNVPDGLATGGLKVAPGATAGSALWKGAVLPKQTKQNGQTNVVVKQTQQQAVLSWETLNVGSKTKLTFDQSKGGKATSQWVAINKITDPSGSPTQILGRIEALGQVYLINQNGILFGGGSQVNTHALVASSLPINENLVTRGLLNNPDAQFLFSSLEIPALANNATMPAFTPPTKPNTPGGRIGDVVVQPGAQLTAPTSADGVGGRIALVGANVRNEGEIYTPAGQTILAAGLQVGFAAHASSDPSLRGLDVYIGKVREPAPAAPAPTEANPNPVAPPAPALYAGTATNAGIIEAPRASVVIAGRDVKQMGAIQSSTSVALNGRIDLQASYNTTSPVVLGTARFASGATGSVTLGPGSITTILPEVFSDATIAATKLPIASQVNIEGKTIRLGDDSLLLAPNANVTIRAGQWLPSNGTTAFVASAGQVYLDPGATINVAGTPDVIAAMAQNILSLELRGAELADSPTQRDGILRGLSLSVDLRKTGSFNGLSWAGTPLGDVTGYVNLIERNVAQLTTAGGSVSITAGGSVVLRENSVVDVSGGWTNFEGGYVETTRVVSAGRIYDISDATPDLRYSGIYRAQNTTAYAKWGIAETFSHPLGLTGRHWENAYTQGGDAGSIQIKAPAMALDGTLLALTASGERQREVGPKAGTLGLTFTAEDATHPLFLPFAPTPPQITFTNQPKLAAADEFSLDEEGNPRALRADRRNSVELSPTLLTKNGFGSVTINNPDGDIRVPAGVTLSAPENGVVSLAAANVDIQGSITAPEGSISLTAYNIAPGQFLRLRAQSTPPPQTPPPSLGRGRVELGAGATLSTAGLIVDERPGRNADVDKPLAIRGGNIAITGYDVSLAKGSVLDVSGGLALKGDGTTHWGEGGSISIRAGQDPNVLSVIGGRLELGAALRGFAGNRHGGSLEIQAPLVQIGGSALHKDSLVLDPGFFSQGGFGNFTIAGLGVSAGEDAFLPGVYVAPGTTIRPVAQSFLAQLHGGVDGTVALVPFTKPVAGRSPVSLNLQAPGVVDTFTGAHLVRGEVLVSEGTSIATDPLAEINFKGNTVTLLGSVSAPAGKISVAGSLNSTSIFADQVQALATVHIGSNAVLSARGATFFTPNPFGQRTGQVLPGGSISVTGNILAQSGALLDVSGATDVLDFAPVYVGDGVLADALTAASRGLTLAPLARTVIAQRVDSDAGSITLAGGQSLQSDATLRGFGGGPESLGGTLSVSSGRFYAPTGGAAPSPLDVTLQVTQSGRVAKGAKSVGEALNGFGQFAAAHFASGGFDSLALKGTVEFAGPVSIQARRELTVADSGVLYANAAVDLSAVRIVLGTPFLNPVAPEQAIPPFTEGGTALNFKPTTGSGHLKIHASLVDIGNLSLQRIGKADIIAENGDIRGSGTLDIAGDLSLRAGQIYPPSALTFTIAASEKNVVVAASAQGSTLVTLASKALPPGFGVGSPLLGSTVQSISGTTVTLAAGANRSISEATPIVYAPGSGSVRIAGSGVRNLPYSAGGQLNIFGATIHQAGTLVAPLGGITLGWDGTGTAPKGAITGENVAVTKNLTLAAGSVTSVSAINPADGKALVIPYGLNLNDVSWIDPRGIDITGGGAPQKNITISAAHVDSQAGSLVDLRGGGDLFAYRWVKGVGGSRDILASEDSFAVLPGYDSAYAPYAPFNSASIDNTLGGDAGYANQQLRAGDRIYLGGGSGLAAGTYTLLPARYALLPGAFLVTPKEGVPIGTFALSDGSSFVSGYRFNDLSSGRAGDSLNSRFEVAPAATVRERGQYEEHFANAYLREGAARLGTDLARLPGDAGHLILKATQSMNLAGQVAAQASGNFRAGVVDIASNGKIVINGGKPVAGALALNAAQLNSFGAESLLIGGYRAYVSGGARVTVTATEVLVDNAGAPLRGPDLILTAKEQLTLAAGSVIEQSGSIRGGGHADQLLLGDATVAGSGNGLLARVSADPNAGISRVGINTATAPQMTIEAGARLTGAGIILDSTSGTSLNPAAILQGQSISLNSGQISLQFDNPGAIQSTGLVLGGSVLDGLQDASRLSLLSYSTIDLYGTGTLDVAGALELHTGAIRGFNQAGGNVKISAGSLLLDNVANAATPAPLNAGNGTLEFAARGTRIGRGAIAVQQFENVELTAANGLRVQNTGGLSAQGNLTITTPFVSAQRAATQSIKAGGALQFLAPAGGAGSAPNAGLGASLVIEGATVRVDSTIALPSGILSLRATSGDLAVNGRLLAGGTEQAFYDLIRHTPGGEITLRADAGSVVLGADSLVSVASGGAGADAGRLSVIAPQGSFTTSGELRGTGGGSFSLDVGSLPSLDALSPVLADGGFTREQSFRARTGDVVIAGINGARSFSVSADTGSITVTGTIDASGVRGGRIQLVANGGLTIASGALLTVAADEFDAAGKGGSIALETRGANFGNLDLQAGATIDLSVAAATSESAALGKFGGSLYLRAPQNAAGTDLAISGISSSIVGASSVVAEGYRVFDLTGSGVITSAVQASVLANGTTFASGGAEARLLSGNLSLGSSLVVVAGAEIINRTGNLTLGATNSTSSSDWDLSTYRFGARNAAGVLTLRASGNLVFFNALSDGFSSSAYNATLLGYNAALPANAQSWSYRLTAGADFTAADVTRVQTLDSLGAAAGSLLLGKNAGTASATSPGLNAQTSAVIGNRYQVIRTGSGDITISAGRDVQLLNQFAAIYTAGTQVADPTLGGTFDVPKLIGNPAAAAGVLGAVQQNPAYPAQFSFAGGNITIAAQGDIARYTRNSSGQLVADSTRQLPTNWLYRRGYLNQDTGAFGVAGGAGRNGEIASTAWWVDYSNFFQSVGALGGGNVTLTAGRDVANVDAVIPTNARMPKGAPDSNALVELGGGDLIVRAGRDLDAGVYYVERGHGELRAGGSIKTNATRSPSLTNLNNSAPLVPETWLPTTLFLGKGGFDVSARGDVLLGPTANPFLLPGGFNNTVWYKTYFSTYAPDSFVNVSSVAGDVTLRSSVSASGNAATPALQTWLQEVLALKNGSASFFQPWLRLNETSTGPFTSVAALAPGTLRATAFSGDIHVTGAMTLSPSATGTLELAAAGSLQGVNKNGSVLISGEELATWGSARINLSDANPALIPGVNSPFAYQTLVGTVPGLVLSTGSNFLAPIDALFAESGAIRGSNVTLTSKQALHGPGPLHANDTEPVRIYAGTGNVSGLTLFSGKAARVVAGRDVSDIALYVQNVSEEDLTLVSAGRDIVAYSANTPSRVAARAAGNILNVGDVALAGDIQIAGPGTVEVLAGRNLDLGIGPVQNDGTGVGIATVGNARNPALPFEGANVIAGAGLGKAGGLENLGLASFGDSVLTEEILSKYLPEVGDVTVAEFEKLSIERRSQLMLEIFYRLLRDAGREGQDYNSAYAAVDALFGEFSGDGDISLTSRAIKTQSGGSISLFAPGGKLAVGFDAAGGQAIDQGILTEAGGDISIFTKGNVDVGTSRIFTLRGGDIIIWSSEGDIAAGAAAKTVQAAPPTRVIIDPQSADVATDLAGLATGGGIGVLATVANVAPGDVDLIAPKGKVDAGDAGIRSAGNLNVAAVQVVNAENIQVSGTSAGTPSTPTVAAPNLGALTAAAATTGATTQTANEITKPAQAQAAANQEEAPSIVTVEVLGYGGGE